MRRTTPTIPPISFAGSAGRASNPRFTISNGLLDRKHVKAMGPAVWEFMLLVNWQTDTSGAVRGGAPIREQEVAGRLGRSLRTVVRNLGRLEQMGYIQTRRTPRGLVITILNPKKLFRSATNGASQVSRSAKSGVSEQGVIGQKCPSDTPKVADPIKRDKVVESKGPASRQPAKPCDCAHSPACNSLAFHKALVAREAGGLTGLPSGREVGQAAKLLANVADAEIRATVHYMLETDSNYWNVKAPIDPAAIHRMLPVYRRNCDGGAAPLDPLETLRRQGVIIQ